MKSYNSTKGFGFIVRDGGGKDVFVHASSLQRSGLADLVEGQRVAVDVADGQKGPRGCGPAANLSARNPQGAPRDYLSSTFRKNGSPSCGAPHIQPCAVRTACVDDCKLITYNYAVFGVSRYDGE